jgi:hypothetical protein
MGRILIECSAETRRFVKMESAMRGMKMHRLVDELINSSRKSMPKCLPEAKVKIAKGDDHAN